MTLGLCGKLPKDVAEGQDNMVSELDYGNTNVKLWWVADEMKKRNIHLKNWETTIL
jgi:hypothetical protein